MRLFVVSTDLWTKLLLEVDLAVDLLHKSMMFYSSKHMIL